ncbi:MAG: thermonuclease family protein [Caldisericia bacterium]
MASVLGWTGWKNLDKIKNYYQIKVIFPDKTKAVSFLDGDTFTIKNGMTVRLVGIDAPNRGKENYQQSADYLKKLIENKTLYFEYDQYQDDKFGRILAYVWIDCFSEILIYCHDQKALVNEVMLKQDLAIKVTYQHRKKLKYDSYLQATSSSVIN